MAIQTTLDTHVLDSLIAEITARADVVAYATTEQIANKARRSMQGEKHGKIYLRGGKPHHASAPGEPPAIDTGDLANSVQIIRLGPSAHGITCAAHGFHLELGTSTIAPRPWITPPVEALRPEFPRLVAEIFR